MSYSPLFKYKEKFLNEIFLQLGKSNCFKAMFVNIYTLSRKK
jgi:hypothetical protein